MQTRISVKKLLLIVAISLFGNATLQAEELDCQGWKYVHNQFSHLMKDKETFNTKLGAFLQHHAHACSIPLASVVGALGGVFIGGLIIIFLENARFIEQRSQERSQDGGLITLVANIALGSLAFFQIKKLSQVTGCWLEAKPEMCTLALKKFLNKWQKHKPHVPQVLQPVFATLAQDLHDNNQTFTIINQDDIQKLLESILATELLVSAIRQ